MIIFAVIAGALIFGGGYVIGFGAGLYVGKGQRDKNDDEEQDDDE